MENLRQDLSGLVEKTLQQLGYVLVDLEIAYRGKLLRVFADKARPSNMQDSINIDDCVEISHQLSRVLAVEGVNDYERLEVSSPGLDRVLKKEEDFLRFIGERASVKIRTPMMVETTGGEKMLQKNFVGILRGIEGGVLLLACGDLVHAISLQSIDKARLKPLFPN